MEIAKLILEYIRALAWPITIVGLAIYFRKSLTAILARLRKANLPGGVSLDFQEKIQEAKDLSEKVLEAPPETPFVTTMQTVGQPSTLQTPNERMITFGMEPVPSDLNIPYFKTLAKNDPTLAVAALRIELETILRNMAIGSKLTQTMPHETTRMVIRRLYERGALNGVQAELAKKVLNICNRVIHGQRVSREDSEAVIDAAAVLFNDFRVWLLSHSPLDETPE